MGLLPLNWNDPVEVLALALSVVIIYVFTRNYYEAERYSFDGDTVGNAKPEFALARVSPRYATSRARFRLGYFAFFGTTLLLYVLVWRVLFAATLDALGAEAQASVEAEKKIIAKINESLTQEKWDKLGWFKLYPQLMAALVISGLLPNIPVVASLLALFRSYMHGRAHIPERAAVIYRYMVNNRLPISDAMKRRAIAEVGAAALEEGDFQQAQGTVWQKWATICHLLASVRREIRGANGVYARNWASTDIQGYALEANFRTLREALVGCVRGQAVPHHVIEMTDQVLKQICQAVVCVVFSSEREEQDVYEKLEKYGVPRQARYGFDIVLSPIVVIGIIFLVLLYYITFGLINAAADASQCDAGPSRCAFNSALMAVLLVFVPIYGVYLAKEMAVEAWPMNGQFSEFRLQPALIASLWGVVYGGVLFYIVHMTGYMGRKADWVWSQLPFAILSGLAAFLAAAMLDMPRSERTLGQTARQTVIAASVGLLLFVALGLGAMLLSVDFSQNSFYAAIKRNAWGIELLAIMGALFGGCMWLLPELCVHPVGAKDHLRINLAHYLIPLLDLNAVRTADAGYLNDSIRDVADDLPEGFLDYLVGKGILDANGGVTPAGLLMIRRMAQ
ncbi:hypothetical protein [Azospirillum sp.]|uniref:hypothetical protein n=1 Tax=Azospirillum sp. TaxID=34012 RepID=UPI003D72B12C